MLDQIQWTISHQLRGKPKYVKDFAVRGLVFPPQWEAFLGGLPPHLMAPNLLTTTGLSARILEIYFAKLLFENKETTLQEFKMSMPEYDPFCPKRFMCIPGLNSTTVCSNALP